MLDIKLIANPNAGQGKASQHIEDIKRYFSGHNLDVELTKGPQDATNIAKKASKELYNIVVACGGDGTISEVVNGIAESDTRLGIIPMGTANIFAYEFNIPSDIEGACYKIINAETKVYDLGKMNDHYFACWGGIGLDAEVIKQVGPKRKKLLRSAAFPLTAIFETMPKYKPKKFKLESNNETYDGYWVVFGKMKYWGGRVPMLPDAKYDDGYLDVCLFKKKINRRRALKYTTSLLLGNHILLNHVEYFKTKSFKVSCGKELSMHADCELLPDSKELKIEIVPKSLNVIV